MHGVDQAAFVDVQALGHMTESDLLKIMLGRGVSQHTIALFKLWQDPRRFSPENPPTGRAVPLRRDEFINHFLHFDRLNLRHAAISKVEALEWRLTVRTYMFGVNDDHLIGFTLINSSAAMAAMSNTAAAVVVLGCGVGFKRLLGGRRGRTKITFVELSLLIAELGFETMFFFPQALNLFLQLDALRTKRPRQSEAAIFRDGAHLL